MRDELQKAWDAAWANPGEAQPIGRAVVCDVCSKDWTDDPTPGGFLFGSYGYCPDCAGKGLASIKRFNEERYIKAFCEPLESFGDFVRRMRGADAFIRVTVHRKCRVCGCTDDDCRQCIEKTGEPCSWVEQDLCSACRP